MLVAEDVAYAFSSEYSGRSVFIKRDGNMFHLICLYSQETPAQKRVYYTPDEDFNRSITMDEFKKRAFEMTDRIDNMYSKR